MPLTRMLCRICFGLIMSTVMLAGMAGAANYANGVFSDPANGFRVNVPSDWARQAMSNQDSNTHLFVSPDQNVAVGVTTYSSAGGADSRQLLSYFQQNVFPGSQQIMEQSRTLAGLQGLLRAYEVQDSNGPVVVGAFATKGNGKSYVIWHMIPKSMYTNRFPESDAVMNTFVLTGGRHHASGQTNTPHADRQHAASQHSGTAKKGSSQGTFSRYKDPEAGLQFDLPSGWSQSHPQPHILSIRGKGEKQLMTVNYQVLDRRNPKYSSLAVASKDLYAQLAGLGRYKIASDVQTTIGSMPAHILDVFVNPGDQVYKIRYIEIERPGYMALLSLICPQNQQDDFAPIAERVQQTIAPYPG